MLLKPEMGVLLPGWSFPRNGVWRTADPLDGAAKRRRRTMTGKKIREVVARGGLEPPTPRL